MRQAGGSSSAHIGGSQDPPLLSCPQLNCFPHLCQAWSPHPCPPVPHNKESLGFLAASVLWGGVLGEALSGIQGSLLTCSLLGNGSQ